MLQLLGGNFTTAGLITWLATVLVLLFSLSFHEMSHARMADRLGDSTAREAGRLTLNPLVHLEPIGAAMIFLGAPVAWARPVPVNPLRFRREITVRKGMMLVAVMGPVSNLILAFIACLLLNIMSLFPLIPALVNSGPLSLLILLLQSLYFININLAVFNLLPVPPLDGSKVLGIFMSDRTYQRFMQYGHYFSYIFLGVMIFRPGLLSWVIQLVSRPFRWLIGAPLDFIFGFLRG